MAKNMGTSDGSEPRELFRTLPVGPSVGRVADPALAVPGRAMVIGAARPVRTWLESGWLGHIPLMFGIVGLVKPRRFVELGTHNGASFFAACQAVQEEGLATQCVAVDHWRGDPQAGFFSDEVFAGFRSTLGERYANFATFVRDDFDGASAQFENSSIDLLHIDGFHSYEAVRHDFETWRSKLSPRGVVLFHDVNEHQADFGVWRFWREIEAENPGRTLFFGQSHGLGLLSLDTDESSAVNVLVRSCQDAGELAFLQQYLTSVATMNATYHGLLAGERTLREKVLYEAHVAQQQELSQVQERFALQLADTVRELEDRLRAREVEFGTEFDHLRAELHAQAADHRIRVAELRDGHRTELDGRQKSLDAGAIEIQSLRQQHLREMADLRRSYENSRSWRISRPFRAVTNLRRRRPPTPSAVVPPEIEAFFSPLWYSQQTGVDLDHASGLAHYLSQGRSGGISPHPLFDPSWYAEQLPADERPQADLFVHYLRHGQRAGLDPHPLFDTARYRSQVADDPNALAHPFEHYVNEPAAWGLCPHELFDGASYLAGNPDVAIAQLNPLIHYLQSGEAELRRPTPDFAVEPYRAQYEGSVAPTYAALADFAKRRSDRGTNAAKIARRDLAVKKLEEFLTGSRRPDLSSAAPVVTVAIAVWNQAHFTLACLESLVGCTVPLRVVVVDNASTDQTEELLRRWNGVEVIRNAENRGFLEATNQVLDRVKTPYVLLLNNDATVRPGSIERSIEVLEETKAGAVAAKVILPNGLLQEAGSYLWSDASAQGYLRGEPWQTGASMHRREVDFGSGAFLMMRSEPVRELGGLDEMYKPAYYEEVDLCLRLARAGWPTVYDPAVIVDHIEFGSSPDQRNAIQLQIDHRHMVAERFGPELGVRPAPGTANADVMANWAHQDRQGVLLVDDRLPVGTEGSGLPRAEALTIALASATRRHVLLLPTGEDPKVSWAALGGVLENGVEVYPEYGDRALERGLERLAGRFDTLVVSRFHNLLKLEEVRSDRPELFDGVRLVYDSEAVAVKRERLQAELLGRPWSNDRYQEKLEIEMSAARTADTVLAVSESDAEVFREAGCPDVHLVTHALETRRAAPSIEGRKGLLFVGRLNESDSPNVDSVMWFVENCFDELRAHRGVGLAVVGKISATVASGLRRPGLTVRGIVDDLDPVFDSARVFIAPTRFAAGTPIKVLTAAAAGIPVVCTSLLCEQLGWTPGREIQVADTPQEFVERVGALLENDELWNAQREAAFARVESEFSAGGFVDSITSFLGR